MPSHARTEERPSRVVKESKRYRSELRRLGRRVRALREEHGWTQERAAESMGVDVTHLAKIERGTVNLTFGTIVRIAEGLDRPLSALFPARSTNRRT